MVEGGGSACFSLKPFESLRVASQLLRQELQRKPAAKFEILSFIDHTHPTAAEFRNNTVVRDGLTNHLKIYGFQVASSYGRGIL